MLRPRQSPFRLWIYTGVAFLAGTLVSYSVFPRSCRSVRRCEASRQSDWEGLPSGSSQLLHASGGTEKRKKLLAIVGVQTGFTRRGAPKAYNYLLRRDALRQTWFPESQEAADLLEKETGMMFRFVIGHSNNNAQEDELNREMKAHGAFLRLPLQEAYMSLTKKTLVFLQHVIQHFDVDYIVKVDDDVFLRVDRLPYVIAQWKEGKADYIGCMKTGGIMRDPSLRWYEPQHVLIGGQTYFTHAWGSIYVLSQHAARTLAKVSAAVPEGLRFFNNEDVTVGGWMLAMNITHLDDRRMCEEKCSAASVAVYDIPQCAGLCDAPKSLPILYSSAECQTPAIDSETGELPKLRPYFPF